MNKLISFVLRFKLLHVAYWGYAFVSDLHLLQQMRPAEKFVIMNYLDAFNETLFQALSVYCCIYYLVPKLYAKEKYVKFGFAVLLTMILAAALEILSQIGYVRLIFGSRPLIMAFVAITYVAKLVNIVIITLVFLAIILAEFYYRKDQRNKQLEKDRILSELDFLKAQLNPHFLFNALNSIYILMKEDVQLAETTLLRFSSLLRYQVYECSQKETTVEREVEFIRDYIDLEKVRNGNSIDVHFTVEDHLPYFQVAPFVLIPFVENAFKHIGRIKPGRGKIDIQLSAENGVLQFNVKNTCDELIHETDISKGVGLQNVTRRLELLYPGRHFLQVNRDSNYFMVTLVIEQHEN